MPSIPPVNAVISRIDAPFPEQWRAPLEDFKKELQAIQATLGVMAVAQTESVEAQKGLADLYTKEALEQRASQVKAQEQPQQRTPNEQGDLPGSSRPVFRSPESPEGSPYDQWEKARREEESRSRPPDAPKKENILNEPISMPQHYGGTYTAEDFLKIIGKGARWTNERGIGGGVIQAGAEKGAEMAPNISAAFNIGRTYIDKARGWSEGLQSYSGSLGYQPSSGGGLSLGPLGSTNELNLGPFSFRTPFSSGALSGATSMLGAYTQAMTIPGMSGQQVMQMQQSLAERGWFPDQDQTQKLFDAQAKLYGHGGVYQQLAENPEVMEMMDKATRSGTTSTEEMVKVIEEIPKAAEAAHEGVQQMVADMKAYGEFAESQGGTNVSGYKQALEMATATGMPATTSLALLNSPWTQSTLFRETGLPSYVQGALPGGVKNQAAIKSFYQAARTVGTFKPYETTNKVSGEKEVVSGLSQKAAYMKKFMFPEMSIEQIEKRLRMGYTGTARRAETISALGKWRSDAKGMVQQGVDTNKISAFISGGDEGQMQGGFGHILSSMLDMKTANGDPMFSHEDIKKIRSAGQGLHNNALIEAKYNAAKRILETKASKQSNNTGSPSHPVMIELGPAARKFLQLPNRKTRMKAETNAGSGEPVNHSAVGPTDYLTPQPGTHPAPDNEGGTVWVPNSEWWGP